MDELEKSRKLLKKSKIFYLFSLGMLVLELFYKAFK